MSGRRSKERGKRGEREVAALIREYGFEAQRGYSQSRGGDNEHPDVEHEIPGVHVEVKFQQATPVTLYKWMEQASEDACDLMPVVVMRRNREDWLVCMRAEHWLERERRARDVLEAKE